MRASVNTCAQNLSADLHTFTAPNPRADGARLCPVEQNQSKQLRSRVAA